ncbi:MAG: transcription elongation factor GreA [Lachnospiraceae bacterium]|nr:transcription elongation factor GreA [Lachnospiraceae bacterium]
MSDKKILLSLDEKIKLEEELEHRKVVVAPEISKKIGDARAQGDLSENAEYDSAMDEQAENEGRILEIEHMLKNCQVVTDDGSNPGSINLGSRVKVLNVEKKVEMVFDIVGTTEADSMKKKISNDSPIGGALMGKVAGETVVVNTPLGETGFKILEVTKTPKDEK